jgi:hypothetical protein
MMPSAAETNNYYGLQGYLATLTAADEAKIVNSRWRRMDWK